ncbi:MAG: hypothetical protein EOQ39_03675 [Mesorhizobium sp.]|uniref:hypothetical protein n=1 Tax=Mesorhizobium sp. TaxID=1871066 RepID=UPI000FE4F1CC|nr:hypothetical protein [Mesorhizobium sp.]RWB09009.1 MAG: hypothetical protein EOQ37_05830 [Mesorhizobium sp.]RWB17430.1 MAG: hypothetical protein EOQ39_03675 [Mesorhizobium sp.]
MTDLSELRAALEDDRKLDHLTAQAEAWLAASPDERQAFAAHVERQGERARLLHGLDAAVQYHEWSAAMFREVIDQIKAGVT